MNKKLMKGRDSLISGVCSGLADYFDQDPTLVRIINLSDMYRCYARV